MPEKMMKMWVLRPVDALEPPFHFHNMPQKMVVAAADEAGARDMAGRNSPNGAAWRDEALSSCAEIAADKPMFIAADLRP